MNVDGNHERADALRVNVICVDENQCKEKERRKKTYLVGCERMGALACGDGLDANDCEDKEKEEKRKERKKNLPDTLHTDGSGCWWNVDG